MDIGKEVSNPNLMVVGDFCRACEAAKKEYAKEIANGELKVISLGDIEQVDGLVDCIYNLDELGVPIMARVESGKIVSCQVGFSKRR